jgi:hypothetical protein
MDVPRKPLAIIRDWVLVFDDHCCAFRLQGRVCIHPRQDEFKSPVQRTSLVVKLDLINDYAETENTRYLLGVPYQGSTAP